MASFLTHTCIQLPKLVIDHVTWSFRGSFVSETTVNTQGLDCMISRMLQLCVRNNCQHTRFGLHDHGLKNATALCQKQLSTHKVLDCMISRMLQLYVRNNCQHTRFWTAWSQECYSFVHHCSDLVDWQRVWGNTEKNGLEEGKQHAEWKIQKRGTLNQAQI